VIVPGRARPVWGLARFMPGLASRAIAANMSKELRHRS
jgi:hypothetical protein